MHIIGSATLASRISRKCSRGKCKTFSAARKVVKRAGKYIVKNAAFNSSEEIAYGGIYEISSKYTKVVTNKVFGR